MSAPSHLRFNEACVWRGVGASSHGAQGPDEGRESAEADATIRSLKLSRIEVIIAFFFSSLPRRERIVTFFGSARTGVLWTECQVWGSETMFRGGAGLMKEAFKMQE